MDLFSLLAQGATGAGSIQGIIGSVQSGYNLYKDLNNIDLERLVAASKEIAAYNKELQDALMLSQHLYNQQSMEQSQQYMLENMSKQQGYTRENMATQNDYLRSNMGLNQKYNLDSMAKQFMYNSILSSAGRNILQQRLAGINPSSGQGSGNVTALSPSGSSASAPSPSASAPSPLGVTIGGSLSPSFGSTKYNPDSAASAIVGIAQSENLREEAAFNRQRAEAERIDNITRLTNNKLKIDNLIADIRLKISQQHNTDVNTLNELKRYEKMSDMLQAQIDNLNKTGVAAMISSKAREKEADNAQQQVNENTRHNMQSEAIERIKAKSQVVLSEAAKETSGAAVMDAETRRKLYDVEVAKLPSILAKMDAEIVKLSAEARTVDETRDLLKKKIEAEVTNLYSEAGLNDARKYHEYERMVMDIFDEVLTYYNSVNPLSKITDEIHGVTPQGRKRVYTTEKYER